MSFVRIEQRNARLAAAVKLDQVKGSEGPISKGTVVVISNARRGAGKDDEVTSIQWTLWGKQAENASAMASLHVVSQHVHLTALRLRTPNRSLHAVSLNLTPSSSQ